MSRTSIRAVAVVTLAALFAGTATASFAAAAPEEVTPPASENAIPGRYIVLLDDKPVAGYEGGVKGIPATKPANGKKLDAHTANAQKYIAHLQKKQADVAAAAGVTIDASYQVTLNGFSATLTAEQVAKLKGTAGVMLVEPDEVKHVTAAQTGTQFLGLEGAGGVWEELGGIGKAGKGIVVGVIDTGIAPENPSFAGAKLGNKKSAEPYLSGNTVVFDKADGSQFRSDRVGGENWNSNNYSTKLIGAQFFFTGAKGAGFKAADDFVSPRDGDGHGSHTASTAAGNNGVPASINGVDFGEISGVAPAAKIAAYKACWNGPDPASSDDDGCINSDLLDAIDAAVADGVDVINFSIGGGAATSVLQSTDLAFFYAAAAGVFVSASAGNSGPGASTADHASPWYTTVAASTIPTWEATVEYGSTKVPGASVTVPFGESITKPAVYAGDIPAGGAAAADAARCFPGTLDAARAAGKIVVCDRGVNARVEKSAVVAQAGGAGMVLVNVTPNSLDNDFHSVPTVHINSDARTPLLTYLHGTPDPELTLVGENTTGIETPTPQVAGFSSRGPMLADGSDVIKPDISAPGVSILAATHNDKQGRPTFGILSGTSMAAPHIAGIAALYLSAHPTASPAEVKSAMMTTAYDTKNADGTPNTDPFAQGAGHADPTKFLTPGLLYLNGVLDWAAYLEAALKTDIWSNITPLDDPSNLNIASIGIGALSQPQTVVRTVTATTAGTYTASVSGMAGVDVRVSPATFTIAAGGTQRIEVTFSRTTAPTETWATGYLTWTGGGTTVRSPMAVYPITADAPADVTASLEAGTTTVQITPGLTGSLDLVTSGLTPMTMLVDPAYTGTGHSGDQSAGDANGDITWTVDVPAGTAISRFTLDSSDDTGSDLDLFVYRLNDSGTPVALWQSATASADEEVTLVAPVAAKYRVVVNMYSVSAPMTWDMWTGSVPAGSADGGFAATPDPLPVTQGVPTSYTLSWSGLAAGRYLGVVQYGTSAVRTVVTVK